MSTASTGALAAYVPRLLREWISGDQGATWREVDGSLVLVDVSGFTRLSEELARQGKIGAEELADTIGMCFAELLRTAYAHGAGLLKFGGDALLLLFTDDGHAARACRSAVGMRTALEHLGALETSGGPVRLRMSVGVHSGPIHCFLVGASHRELLVCGPGASETVRMESAAKAGEILVSRATASLLPSGVLGRARRPGRLLAGAPAGESTAIDLGPALGDAELLPFVPVSLRERLTGGAAEPEHRRVTVAFLRFAGSDALIRRAGPAAFAADLDLFVRCVQDAADRHGVSFLATDVDGDGGKVILAAGAPDASGNDKERMLLALRGVVEADQPLAVRAGVTAGSVFAGDIGPSYRRTYTVMGDAVNLAARLMGKAAPGEVLATEPVVAASRTRFEAGGLEPFVVKGKRDPVYARRVGRATGTRAQPGDGSLPLLGRERELGLFTRVLRAACDGKGTAVEVVGEAGIGKSTLVEAVGAGAEGFATWRVGCELYRSSTPYWPVRTLLREALGIAGDECGEPAAARLLEVLRARLPELVPWAPLLAIPFDLELPPTEETASLDEQFRRARLHELVLRLLGELWPHPTLLTVEDAQWIDEASADLLRHVAARLDGRRWVLCITRREDGAEPDGGGADGDPPVRARLGPLDPEATAVLAEALTDAAPLPRHELTLLARRSGGNPMFLAELVAGVRDPGGLGGLPGSVEAVVTARIDRLPTSSRALLRQVSVLGQRFGRDLADALLEAGEDGAWADLAEFLSEEGGEVRFRSTLVRDAAYEGLPYRQRRRLHATAGDMIARAQDDQAELLSFHYALAGRHREAWRYSLAAATDAAAMYANEESAGFYQRALDAAAALGDLPPAEVARVAEALGDTLERMGDLERAGEAYRRARDSRVDGDVVVQARLLLKQARLQAWQRRYSQALGLITRGLGLLKGAQADGAAAQRAQLMVWYGHFRQEQGRHDDAIEWSERAIAQARAADDADALAHAYRLLDWVHADRGEPEQATNSARALALYEQLGDLPNQASVLNNMGGIAYWEGRWTEALELYRRAYALDERTGDVVGAAFGRNNIGEILLDQGRIAEAEELFLESERVFRAAGYRNGIAFAKSFLGRVAARARRFDEALALLDEAGAVWAGLGAEVQTVEAAARIAECHALRGDAGAALAAADAALAAADSRAGVASQSPLLHRVRGYAYLQRGELEHARAALEASLAAAGVRGADYEVALTGLALAHLEALEGSGEYGDLRARSRATLDRLGVERVPDVPLSPLEGSDAVT